jgi:hypothetical protein
MYETYDTIHRGNIHDNYGFSQPLSLSLKANA